MEDQVDESEVLDQRITVALQDMDATFATATRKVKL